MVRATLGLVLNSMDGNRQTVDLALRTGRNTSGAPESKLLPKTQAMVKSEHTLGS